MADDINGPWSPDKLDTHVRETTCEDCDSTSNSVLLRHVPPYGKGTYVGRFCSVCWQKRRPTKDVEFAGILWPIKNGELAQDMKVFWARDWLEPFMAWRENHPGFTTWPELPPLALSEVPATLVSAIWLRSAGAILEAARKK